MRSGQRLFFFDYRDGRKCKNSVREVIMRQMPSIDFVTSILIQKRCCSRLSPLIADFNLGQQKHERLLGRLAEEVLSDGHSEKSVPEISTSRLYQSRVVMKL